jgi:hypothetical protein
LLTCPNLHILATSREALGIAGELIYRVPSLSLPHLQRLPAPETLTQYEAVRLFVERAAFSKPGFQITASNAVPVAQVTQRLDGIPLAIELTAARVKALPGEHLLSPGYQLSYLLTSPPQFLRFYRHFERISSPYERLHPGVVMDHQGSRSLPAPWLTEIPTQTT